MDNDFKTFQTQSSWVLPYDTELPVDTNQKQKDYALMWFSDSAYRFPQWESVDLRDTKLMDYLNRSIQIWKKKTFSITLVQSN